MFRSFLQTLGQRWRRLALVALVCGAGVLAHSQHWDDRVRLWLHEQNVSPEKRAASIWLPGYRAVVQGKSLAGLENDETSDLAYNPVTRTLFTVTGKKPMLVELSREGEVLRRIPLIGFSNPEGVAVLENGNVAVIDERRRSLSIFQLDPLTLELNAADSSDFDLGFADSGNKGFEGIAWDALNRRLLLGKERQPIALFSLDSDGNHGLGEALQPLPGYALNLRNLSALSIDPRTGHLLVLSAQSNLLLELDERGQPVSFISLLGGLSGLERGIPRAEGVAMDEAGDIYMVSEPNLFYVFRRGDPGSAPALRPAEAADG